MQILAPLPPTAGDSVTYIAQNLNTARRWLDEAAGLLRQRPAMVIPEAQLKRAVSAAYNAAECLYDVGQVDEPVEAVREALAAADAIVGWVRHLERPAVAPGTRREHVAEQLLGVDRTLASLERSLGITHVGA